MPSRSRRRTCRLPAAPVRGRTRRVGPRRGDAARDIGVLTKVDRAALAAYCQAYGRWVEAEEKMKETPVMLKTPSGYVQQSPWMSVANKQLELMGRFMTELGMTPAARSRVQIAENAAEEPVTIVRLIGVSRDKDGTLVEHEISRDRKPRSEDGRAN